jgi:bifunctional non-homologous end joining protein LigD
MSPRFVVHEHTAVKAGWHHDLRLERNRALKSWAVPKGVPESPGIRRLAIRVEDHALGYVRFEGEITEGYGAGQVTVWDLGTYEAKSWSRTKIEVTVHGKRLQGDYILRWMPKMKNWLLWKLPDSGAPCNAIDNTKPGGVARLWANVRRVLSHVRMP